MIWDWLVQRTGKYCSIRRIEYPEFQTGIFGRMESALYKMSGEIILFKIQANRGFKQFKFFGGCYFERYIDFTKSTVKFGFKCTAMMLGGSLDHCAS